MGRNRVHQRALLQADRTMVLVYAESPDIFDTYLFVFGEYCYYGCKTNPFWMTCDDDADRDNEV